ncbi:lysine--tRNA ligase [Candidatus Heimdallarchaeota archaeon B3_Heim]|nr:MAG: lysine--tRNA ligase [Candidatus Heimdallarchaeota archaeon B3_Heim]
MSGHPKPIMLHWVDKLTEDLIAHWPDKKEFHCNCGISVSGRQHVGRLRGEIVLTNAVVEELKRKGVSATHYLILYTSDPWKGKEAQLNAFSDPKDAEKYINWRLVDVPDPTGKHSSWIDYYWKDFGNPLPKFGKDIKIIRTHEFYQTEEMKKTIVALIQQKEKVRGILNKYRAENPFPENWIPFNPICDNCHRIGTTKALEVDLKTFKVRYSCSECEDEGWSDMKLGKLTWRLEWLAIWYTLNIHFEPYGKDHATPGGSRDSCIEVLETVLEHPGPYGFWNEWVGYSEGRTDFGDMTSSGFIGFTPTTWLQYAESHVLRYLYLKPPPKRRIVLGLDKLPSYIAEYDKAQRIYHNIEPFDDPSELQTILRSYEIAHFNKVPEYIGFQLDYNQAIILGQLVEEGEKGTEKAIIKLIATGILETKPSPEVRAHIHFRLNLARKWIKDCAPPHLQINIPSEIPKEIIKNIDPETRKIVLALAKTLETTSWTQEEIKKCMIELKTKFKLSRKQMAIFFGILYQIFLGTSRGPRFAPFIAALEQEWVIGRLTQIK